jgi:two-component system NtrC family sensor kinase
VKIVIFGKTRNSAKSGPDINAAMFFGRNILLMASLHFIGSSVIIKTMRISLRSKLVISFLAVIIICGLVATLVGMRLIGTGIIRQAQEKVRNDLNSARELYRQESENVRDIVRFTAVRFFVKDAISTTDIEKLQSELAQIREVEGLDVLTLTDENGRVVVRSRNPSLAGDSQTDDALVHQVLSRQQAVAGTTIAPKAELVKEGEDLAAQAHIRLIDTPKAKRTLATEQTSGMMIRAAAPVLGYEGNLIGVLHGGNLLNKSYKIVDKIKDTVYQAVKYKGKDIGTATIFQGDLRISTNVRKEDGSRAIGTRVSEEVYEQVLVKGMPWVGRAFVVNNWYIAAYEPIKNIEDEIIGILYVGVLEEKFTDMRSRAIATFLGIMLAGMIMALIVSDFLARGVLGPIKGLVSASHQWAKGDLDHRVETAGADEIAKLAETFNLMASSLKERDEKLREYASQQIMKSERLATLGQLAAGVAHEVNNPLGAVLMYTHLVLENLDEGDVVARENLAKAIREASRCKDIVKGLLDFARQSEPKVERADVGETLERTLAMIENQALFQNVKITKVISPSLPEILMDISQMQQVFTNIVLNAAEAMEGAGELTVAARVAPDNKYVEIKFTDTGCGIPPENREKIFDPFFTTKQVGRGTGLGLAVSHGIIARHQGIIEVESKPGQGTTFVIRLPVNRKDG